MNPVPGLNAMELEREQERGTGNQWSVTVKLRLETYSSKLGIPICICLSYGVGLHTNEILFLWVIQGLINHRRLEIGKNGLGRNWGITEFMQHYLSTCFYDSVGGRHFIF
jgi:hypothetical protein